MLYILGLEEVSENNKKLIKPNPNSNGLINETIKQLEDQKDITGEKAVSIAFELVITWLNRILFLKLFESQLVSFNDNKNFKFITSDKVIDFDELNKLFFSILGKKLEDRDNAEETTNIPYLNSSLFEKSDMELKYINTTALLVREITNPTVIACLVSELMVNDPQIITIINKEDGNNDLRMLWAILNSKLATFYHFNHSPKATKGAFPKILVKDLKEFPIAWGTDEINKKLISLSEEIHNMKQNDINADTSKQEAEIDKLVYHLYGLTDEEIKIVEEGL